MLFRSPSGLTVTSTRLLVDGSGVTQPVSGTVTANISGSISNTSFAATQATAANLNATVVGTGTFAVQAAQSGTWNIGTLTSITNTVPVKATSKFSIGSTSVMTVTNLQSLASSATAGWQSARVSNLTTLATDYEIFVKLTTANTAPASDKCMYVYI